MAPLSWPSVHAYFGRAARRPCNNLTCPVTLARFLLTRARVPLLSKGKRIPRDTPGGVPGSGTYPGRYTPTLEPSEPFGTLPDRGGSPCDHPCRLAPMADRQGFPKERSANCLRVPRCRAIFQMSPGDSESPREGGPALENPTRYGTRQAIGPRFQRLPRYGGRRRPRGPHLPRVRRTLTP